MAGKKSGASRKDSLAFFAITSPSVHSLQRPENINNLYPVVTSRGASKRATAHRDWSHLAVRKPATIGSRARTRARAYARTRSKNLPIRTGKPTGQESS